MAVHLVFITKYRYRVLDGGAVGRLRLLFRKVSTDFESPLTEMHGEDNHVLRQERPDLARRYSERRAVVAFLFRRQLRRCLRQHSQELYRAAEETALTF